MRSVTAVLLLLAIWRRLVEVCRNAWFDLCQRVGEGATYRSTRL